MPFGRVGWWAPGVVRCSRSGAPTVAELRHTCGPALSIPTKSADRGAGRRRRGAVDVVDEHDRARVRSPLLRIIALDRREKPPEEETLGPDRRRPLARRLRRRVEERPPESDRGVVQRRRRLPLPPVRRTGSRARRGRQVLARRRRTRGESTRDPEGTYDATYGTIAVDGDVAVATGYSSYVALAVDRSTRFSTTASSCASTRRGSAANSPSGTSNGRARQRTERLPPEWDRGTPVGDTRSVSNETPHPRCLVSERQVA